MVSSGNLYASLPGADRSVERFDQVFDRPGFKLERIVSFGQATPSGQWYDQPHGEWVLLMTGAAELRIEGEPEARRLGPGDWVNLPPHCRHRVEATCGDPPTVWLAIHYAA